MRRGLVTAGLFVLALAPAALAGPNEDYAAVRADWQRDGTITACRFSERQLENARRIAASNPDDQYTDLPAQIDRELARIRAGRCEGRPPDAVRERSPLAALRITRTSPRGGAARESVRIRNRGRSIVDLTGATIRNRRGARARLPRGLKLRRGATLTVRIGCLRGRRTARGRVAYACRRRALFADRGDVARLADRRGFVVSQRGFGRFRGTASF